MNRFFVSCLALVLSGCASYPDKVSVPEGTVLTEFTKLDKSNSNLVGQTVRWSGVIAKVSNEKEVTKLDVLYYPASNNGRPQTTNEPLGRFRVVINGFIDPAVYSQGKAITALGKLKESETAKIGEYEYAYPTLISQNIHLWKKVKASTKVELYYGLHGIYPSDYRRHGVRRVYVVGDNKSEKTKSQAKPNLKRN